MWHCKAVGLNAEKVWRLQFYGAHTHNHIYCTAVFIHVSLLQSRLCIHRVHMPSAWPSQHRPVDAFDASSIVRPKRIISRVFMFRRHQLVSHQPLEACQKSVARQAVSILTSMSHDQKEGVSKIYYQLPHNQGIYRA